MNQKPSEAGWFYHAPARPNKSEPADCPAMSQIPGLTDETALGAPNDEPRSRFRDTDTKYVRLAKQGGRPNLLIMKENSKEKKPAVGYPRNEWFYLADNAIEDEEEKLKDEKEYSFLRPDYMVHEKFQAEAGGSAYERRRGPIAFDQLSVFEREPGRSATDKKVRLPEVQKEGYGVRNARPPHIPKQHRSKPPSAQTDPGRQRLKYLPLPNQETEDRARIGKLLAYGYDKDWHDQILNWQKKQDSMKEKTRMMTTMPQDEKISSEYTSSYNRQLMRPHQQVVRKPDPVDSARSSDSKQVVKQNETQRLREAKLKKPEEKAPFKIARFKNIPAKTESHRQAHSQVPVAGY